MIAISHGDGSAVLADMPPDAPIRCACPACDCKHTVDTEGEICDACHEWCPWGDHDGEST